MATYWENSCSFGLRYVSWYKYLIVRLVFSHLGFWSGNLFLIAPFPDLCLLVPFHKTVLSSAASTLGHPSRKHQDWFDENDDEIQRLLEEKHRLHKAHQDDTSSASKKAAYSNICKTVQTKLRDMQDSWLRKKTEEIQSFADRKDMKKFHDALKTIYGPKSSGATTLLSADGNTLLTDKEAILERWAEHFNSVLNRPSSINEDAIDRLPQIECNVLLDEFPTVTETRKVVQQLSSGKAPGAPGADAIPAELEFLSVLH